MELTAANYATTTLLSEADYILTPLVTVSREEDGYITRSIILRLYNNTPERTELVQVGTTYVITTDTYEWNLYLIYQAMANVPLTKGGGSGTAAAEDWAWKNKWLYLGLQGITAPGFYTAEVEELKALGVAFGAGVVAEFQMVHWYWPYKYLSLSLQTGADLLFDRVSYRTVAADPSAVNGIRSVLVKLDTSSLSLPLLFKVNYKPSHFVLSLYGGANYILPLSAYTVSPPLGLIGGFMAGIKAGRGVLFLDIRYSGDLGVSSIRGAPPLQFQRRSLFLSVGFEFGLFTRLME
jgi:hypothetical protein